MCWESRGLGGVGVGLGGLRGRLGCSERAERVRAGWAEVYLFLILIFYRINI